MKVLRKIALGLGFNILMLTSLSFAQKADKRGLLPELQIKSGQTEDTNELKAMGSEILITRTENKAIEALQNILKKKVGSKEEPDLLYRLAELYMRRSKSGRFFDVHQNFKTTRLTSVPVPNEKGTDSIRKAIVIYNKIENSFKNYPDMDSVLFNNAFAHQQIKLLNVSEPLYKKLISQYPKSHLLPDGILALSELLYDQQRFADALVYFKKLEGFPESKVYAYGLYKLAWTYYNLKDSESGVQKLLDVVKLNPLNAESSRSYNLRKEALRDLTIFIGDTIGPKGLYPFFARITSEEELGQSILDLARLYDSHSRFKEIPLFVNEYNEKHPNSGFIVKTNMLLVNSYEVLKQREEVLKTLKVASGLCRVGSEWRKIQSPENIDESCNHKFREESLEISKKWWEVWLKNKSHKEFSSLTERALQFILENDNPEKPDFKTRYALAELQFQIEKYEQSSAEYKKVAETSTEKEIAHDAAYAALFSIEKALEKNKNVKKPELEALRKLLVQFYIQKQPQGEFILPVQFKWALLLYEENQMPESLNALAPLLAQKKNPDVRIKSEDLTLDILNSQKNFSSLKNKVKEFIATTTNPERKSSLNKIYEEAHYSEVQALAEKGDKIQAAQALIQFAADHPSSRMKNEAHWQALSLYYSQGRIKEASDLSLEFVKKNPQDKRSLAALKEAINSKIELGGLTEAAEILKTLIEMEPSKAEDYWLKSAQYYWLEGKKDEARGIYSQLLKKSASKAKKTEYQNLILATFSREEKKSQNYTQFIGGLVSQGIEPYATENLYAQALVLLQNEKRPQAFELAKKIMSRDVNADLRTKARLIQAQILEDEFKKQSVKSSQEDRLAMVISMKAEKMEKSLTSYVSAMKMSDSPDLQIRALQGVDRVYQNYIESLSDLRGPASLSQTDLESIKSEINKSLVPIKERQVENKKQIQSLQAKVAQVTENSWESLPVSDNVTPQVTFFPSEKQTAFLPDSWIAKDLTWKPMSASKSKCPSPTTDTGASVESRLKSASHCYLSADLKGFQTQVNSLLQDPQTRLWGFYYLSLLSEKQGLFDKALWASEKALQALKDPSQGKDPFWYQRHRMKVRTGGWEVASEDIQNMLDIKMSSVQIETLKSFQFFKMSQYEKTVQILSRLSQDELYNMNAVLILSEALAQKGEIDQALKTVKNSRLGKTAEGLLQVGRIFESYRPSLVEAQDAYAQGLKTSSNEAQKRWLERKLDYLRNLNKVGQM